MSKRSDEIRNKYIQNPPEGMTADDIRHMSEDDLLDMDYLLNEDDEFGEDFPGAEGFVECYRTMLCVVYDGRGWSEGKNKPFDRM